MDITFAQSRRPLKTFRSLIFTDVDISKDICILIMGVGSLVLGDNNTRKQYLYKIIIIHSEKWEEEWLMSFNPNKCEIIHIFRKQKPIIFQYTLHNQVLKSTNKAKYLGVTIYQ